MIASVDPRSGELVALFNPRKHEWREHFCLQGRPYNATHVSGPCDCKSLTA